MTPTEQHIGYMYSFIKNQKPLLKEDWKIWLPLIEKAYIQVNEECRRKRIEILYFFNHLYPN